MFVEQFEDKYLSHFSYAILDELNNEVILIDPARDISPYLEFAKKHEARIAGVIETHPHADFISGHLELHYTTGAVIYCSKLLAAGYPHKTFDEGNLIESGKIKLKAINTPGHSPDSISIILEYDGLDTAVFTGDTLFIGDCGRPDLREDSGNLRSKKEELAKQMYHSLRHKLMLLNDQVIVYPAHGAGSLCGKALSTAHQSTIGKEKISNWSLQAQPEGHFVKTLIEEQPFIPKYFPFDVELNKMGAANLNDSLKKIKRGIEINASGDAERLDKDTMIVDTRPSEIYKTGHLFNSINLMSSGKFETWLGSIIRPEEYFYLAAENDHKLENLLIRIAKIGYESFIKEAFVLNDGPLLCDILDLHEFRNNLSAYTIIDVRNDNEVKDQPIFNNAISIPLHRLRDRILEVPEGKSVVVHCAGGYRSAAGSSILANHLKNTKVYDLGSSICEFSNTL